MVNLGFLGAAPWRFGADNLRKEWRKECCSVPPRFVSHGEGVIVSALTDRERTKFDRAPDAFFYQTPRLVRHADSGFHERLTELYREHLPVEDGSVLDMMSSWVSHYPAEMKFKRVSATGMNREELAANPILTDYIVHDLNADPTLPFDDGAFDAVTCALSVQYLQYPERVFSEIARVLRPRGVAIFSFSNRMFFTKAIDAWRNRSGRGRLNLVKGYFINTGAFDPKPQTIIEANLLTPFAPQLATLGLPYGGDPFFAVVAHKYHAPTPQERADMRAGQLTWIYATGTDATTLRQHSRNHRD